MRWRETSVEDSEKICFFSDMSIASFLFLFCFRGIEMTLDNVVGPVLKCCRPRGINTLLKAKNKNLGVIFKNPAEIY